MAAPLILPSLLLALVLVVSGVAKLRDPRTSEDAFTSLRLPGWMSERKLPSLLPYGELLLAACLVLVPGPAYLVVTLLSALLLAVYLWVISRALRFPEPVTCGCFGKLGLGMVDRRTVLRNTLLVLLAIVAVADAAAGHTVIQRLLSFGAAGWIWLLGVAVAIALTAFVTRAGDPRPIAEPDSGEVLDYERRPIPYGALRERETGRLVPLAELAFGQPVLLAMLSIGCGPCERTMALLPTWAEEHPSVRVIAVPSPAGSERLPDLGPEITWMDDPDSTVARTFAAFYPSAVLLGADGLLAGGPEGGFEAIADFVDEIALQLREAGVERPDSEPVQDIAENAPTA